MIVVIHCYDLLYHVTSGLSCEPVLFSELATHRPAQPRHVYPSWRPKAPSPQSFQMPGIPVTKQTMAMTSSQWPLKLQLSTACNSPNWGGCASPRPRNWKKCFCEEERVLILGAAVSASNVSWTLRIHGLQCKRRYQLSLIFFHTITNSHQRLLTSMKHTPFCFI